MSLQQHHDAIQDAKTPAERLKAELIFERDVATDQRTANVLRRTIRRLEKLERLARQMLE